MHAETFAYLLHGVPYEQRVAVQTDPRPHNQPPAGAMVPIPSGKATLGQGAADFGWDNEFNQHEIELAAFAIAKYKVTNGDYLAFVRAGAAPPHFWTQRDGQWFYRGMFAEIPLPLHAPVYVTHVEARAYARWSGKELPTEAQFHRA